MPSRFSASGPRTALPVLNALWTAPLLFSLVVLIHGQTLRYGFNYDDYYFLRPHSRDQILDSFHGSWDTTGVMVPFYRPLTVAFSAARFEIFGLNAVAHHALSIAAFALAALLTGWIVYRCSARPIAGLLAGTFFIAHPAMPYSLVAWMTNQMHLLQVLVFLSAFAWWDAVRTRGLRWWLPLLLLAIVSLMIKEDGVVLLPAIVAAHVIRRRTIQPGLPPVRWTFVAAAALLLVGFVAFRAYVLEGLGGYGPPSLERGWRNVSRTLADTYRLVPADREWQPAASLFTTWLPLLALVAWRWISGGARFLMLFGAAIAILSAGPLIFATKPEQIYLVALGLALVLAGAAVGTLDLSARAPRSGAFRLLTGLVLAAGIATLAIVSRSISRDFEPFGPIVLANDEIVRTWGVVPLEVKDYLIRKRAPGAADRVSSNPVDELSTTIFHSHGPDASREGIPYTWMDGTWLEIHLHAKARHVTIPLRHEIGAFREPARVRIYANHRRVDDLVLTTSDWRHSSIALLPDDTSRLSRMHRIRIVLEKAWRPMEIIPGSNDGRVLGLQVGTPIVR